MKPEILATLPASAVAFDVETHLIQVGLLAPPLVCGSTASVRGPKGYIHDREDARKAIENILETDLVIVGANIVYDLLVCAVEAAKRGQDIMPLIFKKFREDRVWDIAIAEQLHAIAEDTLGLDPETKQMLRDHVTNKMAGYSLDTISRLRLGITSAKVNDDYRLQYHELADIPIDEWPEVARIYPIDDAVNTFNCFKAQLPPPEAWNPPASNGPMPSPHNPHKGVRNVWDLANQCRYDWAAHTAAAWGFHRDPVAIAKLKSDTIESRKSELEYFVEIGFMRIEKLPAGKAAFPGETKVCANQGVIKKRSIEAFGAVDHCDVCGGSGKIQRPAKVSEKTGKLLKAPKPINCQDCNASGYTLEGVPFIRAEKGGISIGRDALYESGDDLLIRYAEMIETNKILSTYSPWLEEGITDEQNPPRTLYPNCLVKSGRGSYRDVVHQLPRDLGVRECIIARDGMYLVSVDFEGGELVTHAQDCLDYIGWSKMAEALNAGTKVHDLLGAAIAGIPYEEFLIRRKVEKFLADCRQSAKPINFGCPGLMGAATLVIQQRKQGPDTTAPDGRVYKGLRFCLLAGGEKECGTVKITEWKNRPCNPICKRCVETAEELRMIWFDLFPENHEYFKIIGQIANGEYGELIQPWSGRIRGEQKICSIANSPFQGRLADILKRAAFNVAEEQFCVPESPAYGSRSILFAHDEILAEAPISIAAGAASRISEIMIEAANVICPDVTMNAEPTLMRRFYKGAEPCFDSAGTLIPWEPKEKAAV